MKNILVAALLAIAIASPLAAQAANEEAKARLSGRTLEVVVAFSNSGGGARFWNVFADALRRELPDTIIRARFNDAGSGTSAANELFAMPEGSLAVGFARPVEIAFAQAAKREDVNFDFAQAKWIKAVEHESTIMAAKRGLPLDMDVLRKPDQRLILPVSVITDTQSVLAAMLNAMTGLHAKVVVGFGNADRIRAVVAGDADIYTQAVDQEIYALLETGDMQSLYIIDGDEFPANVDRSRTLESVLVPGVPAELVDYVKAARGLGRAFYAPPGVSDEDVEALRAIFTAVMRDPQFQAEAHKQDVPIADTPVEYLEEKMGLLMLTDPTLKEEVDKAVSCGMAMSEGTLDQCDFGG